MNLLGHLDLNNNFFKTKNLFKFACFCQETDLTQDDENEYNIVT